MWLDLRRRWVWVVVGALLLAGVGALMGSTAQPSFVSTVRLYLSTAIQPSDPEKLYAQYQISSARVQSQIELLSSGLMRQAVSDHLASDESSATPQSVTVTRPLDTVVIDIQVAAASPEDAEALAQAYGEVAPELIAQVEGEGAPISVTVIDQPGPGSPVTRGTLPNVVIGALLGAAVAAAAAVAVGQLQRHRRGERPVQS
jgi:capsular polysaccharide biosynthesis protein